MIVTTMNNCDIINGGKRLKGLLWADQWWKYEKLPFVLNIICFLLLFLLLQLPFLMSSPRFFNEGSYGQGKLEGLPSGQISLSEVLPLVKEPLESWPEVSSWEEKGSEGREETVRPEVVGPEVGRESTWLEFS